MCLYKPENFDPNKKYPIIFQYYEGGLADQLYQYEVPWHSSSASINVPWFVSRGYLVFRADIKFKLGITGESICNSVLSAAKHLAEMAWIDSSKMSISGQSFAGYETNYLITHSNIFAAAVSSAGITDCISHSSQLLPKWFQLRSGAMMNETGQLKIGATLWDKPDLYIKNTPLFNLHKVTTPFLVMHNTNDQVVPWMQSVELFTGLRRLQKRVWMLQYDEGQHAIATTKDQIDFTIRITQFFDHYLKGYPPPAWMTKGRPAKLKGIDDRLELDPEGSCGDDCKICQKKDYRNIEILDVMNPNGPKYKVDAQGHVSKN